MATARTAAPPEVRAGHQRTVLVAAWTVFVLVLAMGIAECVLGFARGASVHGVTPFLWPNIQYPLNAAASALVGALIAARHPRNLIWVALTAYGLASASYAFGEEYTIYAQLRMPGALPGDQVAAWVTTWLFQAIPIGLALIFLLFPTGAPASRRWGWAMWLLPLYVVLGWIPPAFLPGWTQNTTRGAGGRIRNPLAIDGAEPYLRSVVTVSNVVLAVVFVLSIASLVSRYRRGGSEERHQLKFFIFAAAFTPIGFVLYPLYSGAEAASPVSVLAFADAVTGVVGLPVAIGIAIFKYRLYDIDVVISRTIVYGSLALFITAVYVGIAVGIGTLVGGGGKPNLGLSIVATAIVAVGFQPIRERVQRVANRLVYGKRATPYEVLAEFSQRVAESYATDEVMPRMARVLAEGTGAQRVDVWLRGATTWRDAAVWPVEAGVAEPIPAVNGSLPHIGGAARLVEVRHHGELLGAFGVSKRGGEAMTPVEENLVAHLAGQAGLVLKNVGLTTDLQTRLEELRASRQRLVTAQDEERRRLERNLHDGAQQHLVAIKVKLGLAEMLMGRDPEKARLTFGQLKSDADEALETLRDLARGIYPPLLADKGLHRALESQARKATVAVTVEADGIDRYSQEMEAAVYFCVLEALQNVQKYAGASNVIVRLREANGFLAFEVRDDGHGFDVATVKRGAGLTNMEDRLDALGGTLHVTSLVGQGTTIAGSLGMAQPVLSL